jgi:hypothetical protein
MKSTINELFKNPSITSNLGGRRVLPLEQTLAQKAWEWMVSGRIWMHPQTSYYTVCRQVSVQEDLRTDTNTLRRAAKLIEKRLQ